MSPETIVWSQFSGPVRAFLARRLSSEADVDDVLQEVFLRIHQRLPQLRATEHVGGWIFQIARNALTDALRSRQRHPFAAPAAETALEGVAAPATPRNAQAELARCLSPMIAQLEEPYRTALELVELERLAQKEAAHRVGISLSGMKSRVQRGRQHLQKLLVACCAVEVDRRGQVMDYELRARTSSPCAEGSAQPCGARSSPGA